MRFDSSIRIKSEDSTRVLELSQNVDMKTRLDDQSSRDVDAFMNMHQLKVT